MMRHVKFSSVFKYSRYSGAIAARRIFYITYIFWVNSNPVMADSVRFYASLNVQ